MGTEAVRSERRARKERDQGEAGRSSLGGGEFVEVDAGDFMSLGDGPEYLAADPGPGEPAELAAVRFPAAGGFDQPEAPGGEDIIPEDVSDPRDRAETFCDFGDKQDVLNDESVPLGGRDGH
jgi:hypothetical protein